MLSLEQSLLKPAERILEAAAAEVAPQLDPADARLLVLEEVAGLVGGWDPDELRARLGNEARAAHHLTRPWAEKLVEALRAIEIPASLAISALGREPLSKSEQKTTGAYYTDWRLATLLVKDCVPSAGSGLWVDPACGSGILLTAAALRLRAGKERDRVIADSLTGADLSKRALRATLLSVASTTSNIDALCRFAVRLLEQDSLKSSQVWRTLMPEGASLIAMNPPWERLKATRHEVAASRGAERHYGQEFEEAVDTRAERSRIVDYIEEVARGTRLQGGGEHDLYKLFLELGLGLAAEGGLIAALVPAGLIRSQGTEPLRRELLRMAGECSIAVIENRARNFAIDTRFKFLLVTARVGAGRRQPLQLRVADRSGTLPAECVRMARGLLAEVRPDLSLPEVRSEAEWQLFRKLTTSGKPIGDSSGPWCPRYLREQDMTNDAKSFERSASGTSVPLIEGRHVHQFRSRAKRYISGDGRAAIWAVEPLASAQLVPQWHVQRSTLRKAAAQRVDRSRIGFCDVTGQTNERTLLAARISAGTICGNKVPTIVFEDASLEREDLFLAFANSLVADWLLRRVITTTLNFFLLDGLVLPDLRLDGPEAASLISLARVIVAAEGNPDVDLWQVGQLRAQLDAAVAAVWGLDAGELELVLADFPLLDRGQPTLEGEARSTVTRDAVLAAFASATGAEGGSRERLERARMRGAVPFVPADYA